MIKEYQDERFCDHCGKYTMHECYDSGHERDSSHDHETCSICGYYTYGLFGEQQKPIEWDHLNE